MYSKEQMLPSSSKLAIKGQEIGQQGKGHVVYTHSTHKTREEELHTHNIQKTT